MMNVSQEMPPHAGDDSVAGRHGTETILLVEDDGSVRDVTRRLLQRAGYRVLTAGSARAAIDVAVLYGGTIDLLLTDVVMPDLAGREVAEHVRMIRPGTRVLYMSGHNEFGAKADPVARDGAFLAKPFSAAALAAKVREILDAR